MFTSLPSTRKGKMRSRALWSMDGQVSIPSFACPAPDNIPGSFLEFVGTLEHISTQYTPSTLPYHVIVPALPGFPGLSDRPPKDIDFRNTNAAEVLDSLMVGLGFRQYIAQAGDLASYIVRFMARQPECKGEH